jgi:hypothetical protein
MSSYDARSSCLALLRVLKTSCSWSNCRSMSSSVSKRDIAAQKGTSDTKTAQRMQLARFARLQLARAPRGLNLAGERKQSVAAKKKVGKTTGPRSVVAPPELKTVRAWVKSTHHARFPRATLIWTTSTSPDQKRDFPNSQIEYFRVFILEQIFSIDHNFRLSMTYEV